MICREIVKIIEHTYPLHVALSWDNVGLLVGRMEKEVKRIYVALDLTDAIIDEAINRNADMIITHHPFIFSPLKKITDEHFVGNRVVKLLQHDISYYAMHTNYDVLRMAELSGNMLGLHNAEVLDATNPDESEGIGRIGELEHETTLVGCCELVKRKFHLSSVKVFGDKEKMVKHAAISPGAGKSVIDIAIQKGADVLITGDINHHEGIDAVAQSLAVIDAGHYGLEHIFVSDMAAFLETNIAGVFVEKEGITHPFQMI